MEREDRNRVGRKQLKIKKSTFVYMLYEIYEI